MYTEFERYTMTQDNHTDNNPAYTIEDLDQKTRNRVIRKLHGLRNAEKYLYSEDGEIVGNYQFRY